MNRWLQQHCCFHCCLIAIRNGTARPHQDQESDLEHVFQELALLDYLEDFSQMLSYPHEKVSLLNLTKILYGLPCLLVKIRHTYHGKAQLVISFDFVEAFLALIQLIFVFPVLPLTFFSKLQLRQQMCYVYWVLWCFLALRRTHLTLVWLSLLHQLLSSPWLWNSSSQCPQDLLESNFAFFLLLALIFVQVVHQ